MSSYVCALTLFTFALGCHHTPPEEPTTTIEESPNDASRVSSSGDTPKPDADWAADYASLLHGDAHCPPGYAGTAPDNCNPPAVGPSPEAGLGQSGLKPGSPQPLADVYTQDCAGPDMNEQWITSDPAKHRTNSEYPMDWSPVGSTPERLPQSRINALSGLGWKYTSQTFTYTALPSQTEIDALSSSLPSDTTYHQTFVVSTISGGSPVVSGRLFRVVTTTGGVETWHDHWVLFDNYGLVGGSTSARLAVVTGTSDDPHSPAFGDHPHLKDFLNDLRNDTSSPNAFDASTWDYVQVSYTWSNLPGTAPTGCPPS